MKQLITKIKKAIKFVLNIRENYHIWRVTKDVDPKDLVITDRLLRNVYSGVKDGHSSAMVKLYLEVAKTTTKRILMLRNIVGIQPMSGPVSLGFSLQYKSGEEIKDVNDPSPSERTLRLEIVQNAVTASTTVIGSMEVEKLQKALSDKKGRAEFLDDLASVIADQIISDTLQDLKKLGEKQTFSATEYFKKFPNSPHNKATLLALALNKTANEIARLTRRGCGNFIITSLLGVTLLKMAENSQFKPTEGDTDPEYRDMYLRFAGTLNGTIKVYTSVCAISETNDHDIFIVGYKGHATEFDAGYIYMPYVVAGVAKFGPEAKLFTRNGRYTTTGDTGMSDSSNYYALVTFDANEVMRSVIDQVKNSTESSQEGKTTVDPT